MRSTAPRLSIAAICWRTPTLMTPNSTAGSRPERLRLADVAIVVLERLAAHKSECGADRSCAKRLVALIRCGKPRIGC